MNARGRGPADEDDTVVSSRSPVEAGEDDTVVSGRRADGVELDDTVRVSAPPLAATAKPVMSTPTKRRRDQLRPAPVPAGYGGRAVRASGAGAISTYRARRIPAPPLAPPHRAEAPRVHRVTEGAPSVARRSRRYAAIVLGAFTASCAVSVVGLVLIARAALGV